jgi:hypothetical protein
MKTGTAVRRFPKEPVVPEETTGAGRAAMGFGRDSMKMFRQPGFSHQNTPSVGKIESAFEEDLATIMPKIRQRTGEMI